ncbi:MAG: hypothetical protein CML19_11475 [Pusillimonas sp.]|nr:hypothetical protein [Pusillimonas sp.]
MPNEEMTMMMEQMQGGEPPPMPPPEMMMEQTEEVVMPEGGIASFVGAEEAPMVPEGGIASMTEMTDKLAAMGREGDIYVVHASEGDTVIPMDVLNANPQLKDMLFAQIGEMGYEPERYIVGNELNSINPETGLPEFFFKKLFKSLKKIAKIALPVALAYFGPAALAASGLTTATTAAQLSAPLTGLAAGAGGAAGTLATGGNLKQALTSGAISGLTAGLAKGIATPDTIGALSAEKLPFGLSETQAYLDAQKLAAEQAAQQANVSAMRSLGDFGETTGRVAAGKTTTGVSSALDFLDKAKASGNLTALTADAGTKAGLQAISDPTLLQRAGAFLNPIRDEAGKKLVYNAATKTLEPVAMGAIKAALPAAGATLGGAALMSGGGYGDNPGNIYGDPTPEQIAALRVNFQDFPTTRRPYDPIVRPGRAYGRDGGLASLLPVRKMQTGGGIFDIDPTLSPSGQLSRLNELYADAYKKATTGENPLTEAQFIASPQFQQFEDRLISTIGTLPASASGILTAPIGKGGLEDQEARAGDPTSPYSASASRIAEAMRNQLGVFNTQQNAQNVANAQNNMTANQAMSAQGIFPNIDREALLELGLSESDIEQLMAGQKPAPPPPPPLPPATVGNTITAPSNVETGGYAYYSPFYQENPAIEDDIVRRQQAQQLASERLASARANLPRVADPVASFRQGIEEGAAQKMEMGGQVYGPRRTGEVPGPLGIERDIVAADLMPGEFVFTKDAVEGVGKLAGGGYKDGIKTMYGLMKKFEGVA